MSLRVIRDLLVGALSLPFLSSITGMRVEIVLDAVNVLCMIVERRGCNGNARAMFPASFWHEPRNGADMRGGSIADAEIVFAAWD